MCTDERAASTSAKIRGKKFAPSAHGSIVAAVDHANSSVASWGRVSLERLGRRLRTGRRHRIRGRRPARPLRDPEHLPVDEHERQRDHETGDRERLPDTARPAARASFARALPRHATPRVVRLALAIAAIGIFLPWSSAGPVRLDGTEGPNNGWLVLIVAVLALGWVRSMARGSWIGVIGVLGAGIVIGWTAIENWLDNRQVLDAGASYGLLIVVAASVVLIVVSAAGSAARRRRAAAPRRQR